MGMSVLRLVAVAQLLVGCRSFLLPSPEIPRLEQRTGPNRATSPFETLRSWRGAYGVPSISPRDANRGARPSQVLTSPDDVSPGNQSLGDSADSNGAFKPSVLWWTRSRYFCRCSTRAEEVATLNLVTNAGIMAGVALFALSTVFTVDLEVSRGWTATEFFLRVPVDNWLGYLAVLRNDPVLVKACTSGLVYAVGDWTAQTVEGAALAEIKRGRVLRSALAGLLLHGPLSHVWYDLCEGAFDGIGWNSYWWVPGPKIIADQLLWGPFWNAVYICFLGTLKKDSLNTIKEAVVTTAFPLVLAGIRLWPLAHLVTYGLIPTENRLLWVDFVEIIWVTILSKQAAEQARSAEEEK